MKPLTPLLPDGSMDFPKAVASSNIGEAMSLLVDGNSDTFPGFYLVKDNYYEFDFGPDFKFSATAFAMEGRVNFEDRMQGVKFYGSNDGKTWTELTPEATRPRHGTHEDQGGRQPGRLNIPVSARLETRRRNLRIVGNADFRQPPRNRQ